MIREEVNVDTVEGPDSLFDSVEDIDTDDEDDEGWTDDIDDDDDEEEDE